MMTSNTATTATVTTATNQHVTSSLRSYDVMMYTTVYTTSRYNALYTIRCQYHCRPMYRPTRHLRPRPALWPTQKYFVTDIDAKQHE